MRADFDCNLNFLIIFNIFFLLITIRKFFRIFSVLSIEHFIIILKLLCKRIVDSILTIECIAIGNYESDISVEIFLAQILMSLDFFVYCFKIHWLLYNIVIIGNCLRYRVDWHSERP